MIKFLSVSLIGALVPFFFSSPVRAEETISGEFTYLGNDDVTVREHHFTYSDAFFESTESSYDLLKCSMCAALAASKAEYVTAFMDKLGFEYTNDVDEISEGLNVLAGDKITDSIYYPAQTVDGVDYYNSIGYGIGSKKHGNETIILVAIRGSDYGIEWGGDFDIGTGENHQGFEIAADQVIAGLKNYIDSDKVSGKIVVWVTGYSRGAATANLVAAKLDDGIIPLVERENVHAFCFECPRTTRKSTALDSQYDNIISVANPDDVVPKVAMGVWGYVRFGKTYHIPSYQSDAGYREAVNKKEIEERKILGKDLYTAENIEYQLNQFIDDLAVVTVSPEEYVKHYQNGLIRVAMTIFGHPTVKATPEDYKVIQELQEGIAALNTENTREIAALLGASERGFQVSKDSPILNVHNMENTLSWLDSFSGYDNFGPGSCSILYVNNVQGLHVTDADGKEVVSVENSVHHEIADGLFVRVDEGGQIVVVFPQNSDYSLQITHSDEKYVLVSWCDYDMTRGYATRVLDYDNIVLNTDLEGQVSGGKLSLSKGSHQYKPREYSESYANLIKVIGRAEGRGLVTGGGIYTPGQRAVLVAAPVLGSTFVGWYEGEKKISNKNVYITRTEHDLELTAKFVRGE